MTDCKTMVCTLFNAMTTSHLHFAKSPKDTEEMFGVERQPEQTAVPEKNNSSNPAS